MSIRTVRTEQRPATSSYTEYLLDGVSAYAASEGEGGFAHIDIDVFTESIGEAVLRLVGVAAVSDYAEFLLDGISTYAAREDDGEFLRASSERYNPSAVLWALSAKGAANWRVQALFWSLRVAALTGWIPPTRSVVWSAKAAARMQIDAVLWRARAAAATSWGVATPAPGIAWGVRLAAEAVWIFPAGIAEPCVSASGMPPAPSRPKNFAF